ncbi:S46 family peptidase [Geofilum sp. OHC36d9]|uniref:S46 family peptidase n=1 Tax=Geofilum sp. OHC36d9 TaxID=3458413 RepID=UPI0040340FA4
MKKILAMSFILLMGFAGGVKADEGMWLLPLIQKLNIGTMQEMGLKLTPEQIYSVNHSSLKDAVVIFGGGCTGELISDQGLILTNHHCGYDKIQELSTLEHNYLDDGFWAGSMEEEIPAPGLTVTFLKKMEDVTGEIMSAVTNDMTEEERGKAIQDKRKELIDAASKDNNYKVQVKDYFAGNQYFLIVYETYTDVRFVGAPPSSIGKFGFDTDNWMWPRHTGDFSMFRVYADAEGKPADYSVENVPYQPAYHLPISIKGYEKGDFAMTIGFPGSTERYLPSWGIEERMKSFNQTLITVRGVKQDIWADAMAQSDKIRLQYASKFSRSSNYWKNSIGMNRGLEALNVMDKKKAQESEFAQWVNANESRKAVYGEVLPMLEKGYTQRADVYKAYMYLRESFLNGTEIYLFSLVGKDLIETLESGDQEKIDKQIEEIRETAKDFYKNYDAATDQKVMVAMLNLYQQNIAKKYQPKLYDTVNGKYKGNTEKYAADVFKKTIFASPETFEAFLANPKSKILKKDMALNAANTLLDAFSKIREEMSSTKPLIDKGNRLFMAGMMEMHPEKVYYPDANFTMRLSYGTVGDYEPRDAVNYNYFTTLKGVMEKEDPDNFEFNVPSKLKALYKAGDYGRYAANDGLLHVNFTTNNDITGGNSGSPVINGNGELFGLAFDGNWEAMSGDIAFETELQKCINVDIRYVLFIIDKYAGATRLIDEMTIVE